MGNDPEIQGVKRAILSTGKERGYSTKCTFCCKLERIETKTPEPGKMEKSLDQFLVPGGDRRFLGFLRIRVCRIGTKPRGNWKIAKNGIDFS